MLMLWWHIWLDSKSQLRLLRSLGNMLIVCRLVRRCLKEKFRNLSMKTESNKIKHALTISSRKVVWSDSSSVKATVGCCWFPSITAADWSILSSSVMSKSSFFNWLICSSNATAGLAWRGGVFKAWRCQNSYVYIMFLLTFVSSQVLRTYSFKSFLVCSSSSYFFSNIFPNFS